MILRSFSLLTASLWSLACGATHAQLVPPEAARINQAHAIHLDVGSVRSLATLHEILPRVLAHHGYFITHTQQRAANGLEFVTDWRPSGEQERTRLLIDARPRGNRVALTLYALTYAEHEDG